MPKTESWLWRCPAGTTKQIEELDLAVDRAKAMHLIVAAGLKALRPSPKASQPVTLYRRALEEQPISSDTLCPVAGNPFTGV